MSIRGEKFFVDLSDNEDESPSPSTVGARSEMDFVGDIVERDSVAAKPPTMPAMKSTTTGFPEHRKRTRISAFKQQRVPIAYIKSSIGELL